MVKGATATCHGGMMRIYVRARKAWFMGECGGGTVKDSKSNYYY